MGCKSRLWHQRNSTLVCLCIHFNLISSFHYCTRDAIFGPFDLTNYLTASKKREDKARKERERGRNETKVLCYDNDCKFVSPSLAFWFPLAGNFFTLSQVRILSVQERKVYQ
ncbi:hypothetical protein AAZX31_03G172100 [Glycine max]